MSMTIKQADSMLNLKNNELYIELNKLYELQRIAKEFKTIRVVLEDINSKLEKYEIIYILKLILFDTIYRKCRNENKIY